MGVSIGKVRLETGEVYWFRYQNTADIADARLFGSSGSAREGKVPVVEELEAKECRHVSQVRPAMLWVGYGCGFVWLGEVCVRCLRIQRGQDPFGEALPHRTPDNLLPIVYQWTPGWALKDRAPEELEAEVKRLSTELDDARTSHAAKLTWPKVRTIREQYAEGQGIRHLARVWDVSPAAMHRIVHHETWREEE